MVYDLLLLDIKMPNNNDIELYRKIQKMDNNVKACFITTFVAYYESLKEIFVIQQETMDAFYRKRGVPL